MTSAARPVALLVSLLLLTTACTSIEPEPAEPVGTSASSIPAELAKVKVVASRPKVKGYGRECGKSGACSFGQAWSDNHAGPGGHDGCDTRNNVLAKQLTVCARLINANLGIRVLNVEFGSFDTHVGQAADHANLMAELDAGIGVQQPDLAHSMVFVDCPQVPGQFRAA